ncbi:MAG: type II secretion system protein GspM [Pseudomonadota bacterium]
MMDRLQQLFAQSSIGRWYAGRDPQEQRILLWLGLAVLVLTLWAGIWKPVMDWKQSAENTHRNAIANLDQLLANESIIRAQPQAKKGGPTIQSITQTAKGLGITVSRIQPADGGINLVLQNQPFNDVVGLINQLAENNGVAASRANMDATNEPGRINAQILFR